MNQKEIKKQVATIEKCVGRLSCKSFFQEEGWKRILGVRRFLEAFDLDRDIESFNLVTKEFHIPISAVLSPFIPDISTNVIKNIPLSDIWKTGPFNFLCLLVNIRKNCAHAVVIYGMSENRKCYKIKDSQGKKYELPVTRFSYSQVSLPTYSISHIVTTTRSRLNVYFLEQPF